MNTIRSSSPRQIPPQTQFRNENQMQVHHPRSQSYHTPSQQQSQPQNYFVQHCVKGYPQVPVNQVPEQMYNQQCYVQRIKQINPDQQQIIPQQRSQSIQLKQNSVDTPSHINVNHYQTPQKQQVQHIKRTIPNTEEHKSRDQQENNKPNNNEDTSFFDNVKNLIKNTLKKFSFGSDEVEEVVKEQPQPVQAPQTYQQYAPQQDSFKSPTKQCQQYPQQPQIKYNQPPIKYQSHIYQSQNQTSNSHSQGNAQHKYYVISQQQQQGLHNYGQGQFHFGTQNNITPNDPNVNLNNNSNQVPPQNVQSLAANTVPKVSIGSMHPSQIQPVLVSRNTAMQKQVSSQVLQVNYAIQHRQQVPEKTNVSNTASKNQQEKQEKTMESEQEKAQNSQIQNYNLNYYNFLNNDMNKEEKAHEFNQSLLNNVNTTIIGLQNTTLQQKQQQKQVNPLKLLQQQVQSDQNQIQQLLSQTQQSIQPLQFSNITNLPLQMRPQQSQFLNYSLMHQNPQSKENSIVQLQGKNDDKQSVQPETNIIKKSTSRKYIPIAQTLTRENLQMVQADQNNLENKKIQNRQGSISTFNQKLENNENQQNFSRTHGRNRYFIQKANLRFHSQEPTSTDRFASTSDQIQLQNQLSQYLNNIDSIAHTFQQQLVE